MNIANSIYINELLTPVGFTYFLPFPFGDSSDIIYCSIGAAIMRCCNVTVYQSLNIADLVTN